MTDFDVMDIYRKNFLDWRTALLYLRCALRVLIYNEMNGIK